MKSITPPANYRDSPDYKAMTKHAQRLADLYIAMSPRDQKKADALMDDYTPKNKTPGVTRPDLMPEFINRVAKQTADNFTVGNLIYHSDWERTVIEVVKGLHLSDKELDGLISSISSVYLVLRDTRPLLKTWEPGEWEQELRAAPVRSKGGLSLLKGGRKAS